GTGVSPAHGEESLLVLSVERLWRGRDLRGGDLPPPQPDRRLREEPDSLGRRPTGNPRNVVGDHDSPAARPRRPRAGLPQSSSPAKDSHGGQLTRLVGGGIYLATALYCVLWALVFLRSPLLPFITPDIDVNLLLRIGEVGAAILLVVGLIFGSRVRDPVLQSHLVWLGVSLIVAVGLSIVGMGFLFVGWWLQWEWAAYTAMAVW